MGLFQTFDEEGKLQLDCDLFTHYLRFKGAGTTVSRLWGNTNPSSIQIDLPAGYTVPLIGIQCAYKVGLLAANLNPSTGVTTYMYASDAPIGTAFTYYVFDTSLTIPPNSGMIELYDEQGRVTFSDAGRPMMPLDVLTFGSTTKRVLPWNTRSSTLTFPGKSLAWVQGSFGGHRIAGQIRTSNGTRPIEGGVYSWVYQNNGKVYGASTAGDTITLGSMSYDDVLASLGSGTEDQALARVPPDFIIPVLGFAIDVTNA
jgi:hypothetical protein